MKQWLLEILEYVGSMEESLEAKLKALQRDLWVQLFFLSQLSLSLPLPENKIITSDYFQQYWFGSHIVTCVVNLVYLLNVTWLNVILGDYTHVILIIK